MRATEDFISDEDLQRGDQPFRIWSVKGWGNGHWFVIRKSDRKVVKSNSSVSSCLHWVRNFGDQNLD